MSLLPGTGPVVATGSRAAAMACWGEALVCDSDAGGGRGKRVQKTKLSFGQAASRQRLAKVWVSVHSPSLGAWE